MVDVVSVTTNGVKSVVIQGYTDGCILSCYKVSCNLKT